MKTLLLILFSAFMFQGFAQHPDLYQTWYLTNYNMDIMGDFEVSDIEPTINPTLTISENLDFSGEGACNTFNGGFVLLPDDFLLIETSEFTDNTCDFMSHSEFEINYFSFFYNGEELHYSLEDLGGGEQKLNLTSGWFSELIFSNVNLSVSDNKLTDFKIYPNPATDILTVTTENNPIEKLTVYSVAGMKVLEQNTIENSIDVSALKTGTYFLEIISSEGKSVQKFIKK